MFTVKGVSGFSDGDRQRLAETDKMKISSIFLRTGADLGFLTGEGSLEFLNRILFQGGKKSKGIFYW